MSREISCLNIMYVFLYIYWYLILFKYKRSLKTKTSYRARDGTRTRDPDLGKVVLHQLSHSRIYLQNCLPIPSYYKFFPIFWLNPRPISNHQLNTLLYLHLGPIYLVVFKGSYCFHMRDPIVRGASR